jgi:tetratricopeptide (TPR) repeat protein
MPEKSFYRVILFGYFSGECYHFDMTLSLDSLLEKAHLAALKINLASARSLMLSQIAAVYAANHNPSMASAIASEALKTADIVKYPHEKAKCLAAAAVVLARTGQIDGALAQFNRSILLARAAETPAQIIEALYRIAACYIDCGRIEEGTNLLAELTKLVVDPSTEVDSAAELVNIAELYDDLGLKEEAYSVLGQALAIALKNPDLWFRLERLVEIADTFASSGSSDRALSLIDSVSPLVAKIDEFSRPYFLLRLAEVYIGLKLYSPAQEVLKSVSLIDNSEESAYEKAGRLIEVAEKYLGMHDQAAALMLLTKAGELVGSLNNIKEQIAIRVELAEWMDAAGNPSEAAILAEKALFTCRDLADKKSAIFCLGNLLLVFSYLHNPVRSAQLMDEILKIAGETSAKTAGLGAIGLELIDEGDNDLALRLVEVVREPEVQSNLYLALAAALKP